MEVYNGQYSVESGKPAIFCIGVSHHSAPIDLRERLAALSQSWLDHLPSTIPSIQEWAVIVTCNRWELYGAGPVPAAQMAHAVRVALQAETAISDQAVQEHLFTFTDREAARHLAQVATGLDSLILGESQILGQVTDAYTSGLAQETIGPALSALFRTAIRTGKRARAETEISAHGATMSSLALGMAERVVGSLQTQRVVLIGAGEMVRLAAKALHARQAGMVAIANRTVENARELLLDPRWQATGLGALPAALTEADIVFCATRSQHYIITKPPAGPRVFIDLALPRNIDPTIAERADVTLIGVDQLQLQLDKGLAARRQAIPRVEIIVDEELAGWEQVMRELALRPLVAELRQRAELIRQSEVERTLRFLGDVDDATLNHIQHLSRALVNKLLHVPTTQIKALAQMDDPSAHTATIRELFGLSQSDPAAHARPE
jgi:glutamyl-tRNA reductase